MNLALPALAMLIATNAGAQTEPAAASREPQRASNPRASCSHVSIELPERIRRDPKFSSAEATIRIDVVPPGDLAAVVIVKSSGYTDLDNLIVDTYKKMVCKYDPPLIEPKSVQQTFRFSVE